MSIGMGAIKIKEHREEKKARKAMLEAEAASASSSSGAAATTGRRGGRRREVQEKKRESGRSRSVSREREEVEGEEIPPPSYQEAVSQGRRVGGS